MGDGAATTIAPRTRGAITSVARTSGTRIAAGSRMVRDAATIVCAIGEQDRTALTMGEQDVRGTI